MATIPSISLIPSGYKAGKVYSVLPTDGSADFDFSRNTTATRINKNSLIENVGNNVPRLDYEGGGCPSLLLEPAATNQMNNSEDFTAWSKSAGSSVTITNINNPVNSLNANLITIDSDGIWANRNTPDASAAYEVSFWLQKNSQTGNIQMTNAQGSGSGNWTIDLDLLGSDFVRIHKTHPSVTIIYEFVTLASGDIAPRFISTLGTKSVYVTGFQLEKGSYATSYIPTATAGASVTRLADTANNAGNASTFNDSEGVLMVEISALADSLSYRLISLSGGGTANTLFIGYSQTSNQIHSSVISGGSVQVSWFHSLSSTTENIKCALKYKDNDFALWVNGVNVLTDTSGISPTGLNSLGFSLGSGSFPFYGNCEDLRVYNTALTALELETLTSYTSFNAMALALNYTIQ